MSKHTINTRPENNQKVDSFHKQSRKKVNPNTFNRNWSIDPEPDDELVEGRTLNERMGYGYELMSREGDMY